ncbi:MAG: FtsX-like permease family protein [Gemmatimonadaceae bacterium]
MGEIAIYYPIVGIPGNWRWYPGAMRLIVKTSSGSALRLLPELRRAVSAVDSSIPLANAQSLEDMVSRSLGRVTFTMTLLDIAGGIALLLAAVGLYGLLSYVVGRRTREMGVRLALGARPRQVEAMVVRDAAVLALTGVAVGLIGAIAFTRILRGLLFGVATWDPLSYAGAAAVLSLVAVASAWAPARRAAGGASRSEYRAATGGVSGFRRARPGDLPIAGDQITRMH